MELDIYGGMHVITFEKCTLSKLMGHPQRDFHVNEVRAAVILDVTLSSKCD